MNQPLPILVYHSVAATPAAGLEEYTVTPHQFATHLDCLAEQGRHVLTVGQIAGHLRSGEPLPDRAVAVTFDDGLADFHHQAWPLLRSRRMPATLYTVAGFVGGRSLWLRGAAAELPMLSAVELTELADEGVEMGAHTMTHPQLDLLPSDRARREIAESRDVLEQILGRPVTTFAYPHGHHTRTTRDLVVAAGFTSAAAVRNMFSHPGDDVYALARLTVNSEMTAAHIASLLSGRGARRAPRRELLRTAAGRQWRRLRGGRGHGDVRRPAGDVR